MTPTRVLLTLLVLAATFTAGAALQTYFDRQAAPLDR